MAGPPETTQVLLVMYYFRPALAVLVTLSVIFLLYLAGSKVFGLGLYLGARSVVC